MTALLLAAALAVAAAVQVVSGFGFALVAAPVVVALTDPATSVSLLGVLGVVLSVVVLAGGDRRPQVEAREAGWLVAWALPGLVAGAWLVDDIADDALRIAVGVLVLGALALRRVRTSGRPGPAARAAAGGAAGVLTTTTGLNGPPLVLYLTGREAGMGAVRDTLAVAFLVLALAGLAALVAAGTFTLPDAAAAAGPAVVVGGLAGHRLHDRLTERARERAVTAVLLLAAATAFAGAL